MSKSSEISHKRSSIFVFVKTHTLTAGCSEIRILLTKHLHSTTNDIMLQCFSFSREAKLGIKLSLTVLDQNTNKEKSKTIIFTKKSITGCEKTAKLHSLHLNRFLGNQKVAILKADFVYCVAILR